MSEDDKLLKEAKKWAWEDRLAHKNWKVRNDANIDIAAVCDGIMDPKDPRLKEFGKCLVNLLLFFCSPFSLCHSLFCLHLQASARDDASLVVCGESSSGEVF